MLPPKVKLTAVTRSDRNEIISEVSDAIAAAGGWIEDVNFFSNISVALRFMVQSSSGSALARVLETGALRLETDGLRELSALTAHKPPEEVGCSLQITFFHTEPDLRRPVPHVPG